MIAGTGTQIRSFPGNFLTRAISAPTACMGIPVGGMMEIAADITKAGPGTTVQFRPGIGAIIMAVNAGGTVMMTYPSDIFRLRLLIWIMMNNARTEA